MDLPLDGAPVARLLVSGRPRRNDDFTTRIRLDASGSSGVAPSFRWNLGAARLLAGTPTGPVLEVAVDGREDVPVSVVVTDGPNSSRAEGVLRVDDPPVAVAGPARRVRVGETARLDGSASQDREGDPFTHRWTLAAAPGGSTATLRESDTATPSLVPDRAGIYRLSLVVSGSGGSSAPDMTSIAAEAPSLDPPVVSLTASGTTVSVGTAVTFQVRATVAMGATLASRSLLVDGADVPLDATGSGRFTPTRPGAFDVLAVALDSNGLAGEARGQLFASDTPDRGTRPTATLTGPADGLLLTAPVDIVGTAGGADFARYVLEVAAAGSDSFRAIAAGTAPVMGARLGVLEPSRFAPDSYVLRLTVFDTHGRASRFELSFVVPGEGAELTVGNQRLDFLDVDLDVVGLPLQLTRIYDSFNPREGDFGFNWSLSYGRVEVTHPPGRAWSFDTSRCALFGRDATPLREHILTFRFLDRSFSFRFLPFRERCGAPGVVLRPRWVPMPGTRGTLTVEGEPNCLLLQGSFDYLDTMDPECLGPTGRVYDPQVFTLTLPEGYVLRYARTAGLLSARDPSGNTVTVTPGSIRHSAGVGLTLARDARGRITRIERPDGRARSYAYNAAGDLVASVDFAGLRTQYLYAPGHRLAQVIDPEGHAALGTEYDPSGRVTAYIDAMGRRTAIAYDDAARTRTTTDRLGRRTVERMDAAGHVIERTVPGGAVHRFEHNPRTGQLDAYVDPLGNRLQYRYDASGDLSAVSTATGLTQSFTYDTAGRLLRASDGLGHTLSNTWDAQGRLVRSVDLAGRARAQTYAASGALESIAFEGGPSLRIENDARGWPTALTQQGVRHVLENSPTGYTLADTFPVNGRMVTLRLEPTADERLGAVLGPDGARSTARYNGNGQLLEATDAAGATVRYGYDATGRPRRVRLPGGEVVDRNYDAEGQLVADCNALGQCLRYGRDEAGRVNTVTLRGGGVFRRTYGLAGVTAETDPAGRTTRTEYDRFGRPTRLVRPGDLATTLAYDGAGRVTSVAAPDGATTRFTRDGAGLVTAVRTALPGGTSATTRVTWDTQGNVASVTDPNGNTTRWDAADGALAGVRDPAGGRLAYDTSTPGVRVVTDALGRRQRWEYDPAGNPLVHVSASGARETFRYDPASRTTTRTGFDGRATVASRFDAAGRVLATTASDGTATSASYDAAGRRVATQDARGATRSTYTPDRQLAEHEEPDGRAARYRYNPDGTLAAITTPNGSVAYAYDAAGRLAEARDGAAGTVTFTYDAAGRPSTITTPDGLRETRAYEEGSGRLASITVTDARGATQFRESYRYDAGGRVLEVRGLEGTTDYAYDPADRLVAETFTPTAGGAQRIAYRYDAAGNLVAVTGDGVARSLTVDADDRVTGDGAASYRWDAEGRLVEVVGGDRAMRLTWDGLGRLVAVESTGKALGAHALRYAYDADGLLVERTADGVTTRLLWDRSGAIPEVLEETDASGRLVARNLIAPGQRVVARVQAGTARWLHRDRLGSVRLATATGTEARRLRFTAYGESARGAGPDAAQPYGFAGERLDPLTGMYYLRARHLAPSLGRFVSPDPVPPVLTEFRSFNRYAYAAGSPTLAVDPLGTFFEFSISSIVRGILTALSRVAFQAVLNTVYSLAAVLVGGGALYRSVNSASLFGTAHAFDPEALVFGTSASLVFPVGAGVTGGAEFLRAGGVNPYAWNAFYIYGGAALGPSSYGGSAYAGQVFDCPLPTSYTGEFMSLSLSTPLLRRVLLSVLLNSVGRVALRNRVFGIILNAARFLNTVSLFWSPFAGEAQLPGSATTPPETRAVQSWGVAGSASVSSGGTTAFRPLSFSFTFTYYEGPFRCAGTGCP